MLFLTICASSMNFTLLFPLTFWSAYFMKSFEIICPSIINVSLSNEWFHISLKLTQPYYDKSFHIHRYYHPFSWFLSSLHVPLSYFQIHFYLHTQLFSNFYSNALNLHICRLEHLSYSIPTSDNLCIILHLWFVEWTFTCHQSSIKMLFRHSVVCHSD